MKKTKQCAVCGKITSKFLFNDRTLDIAVCSGKCEYAYINSLTPYVREQVNVLRYLDEKIEKNRRDENKCWTVAGLGLIVVAIGFLISNVTIFLCGVIPLTLGSFSTSHYENRRNKLIRLRKRVLI